MSGFSPPRYPYTYGHDYVRMNSGVADLSRADVANLDALYAEALGVTPQYIAERFADLYMAENGIVKPEEPRT